MINGHIHKMDRLIAILIQLQSKRIVTAKELASRYNVSLRTIYRDIRTLEAAGVPIGSQAGKGYFLAEGYRLPPVTFTTAEAGALVCAEKFIETMGDGSLKHAYACALNKVLAVLNTRDRDCMQTLGERMGVFFGKMSKCQPSARFLSCIQTAIGGHYVLKILYCSLNSEIPCARRVEPIGLFYYGRQWYLHAYCQLRKAYRSFRADRIRDLSVLDETFDGLTHGNAANKVMERLGGISRATPDT